MSNENIIFVIINKDKIALLAHKWSSKPHPKREPLVICGNKMLLCCIFMCPMDYDMRKNNSSWLQNKEQFLWEIVTSKQGAHVLIMLVGRLTWDRWFKIKCQSIHSNVGACVIHHHPNESHLEAESGEGGKEGERAPSSQGVCVIVVVKWRLNTYSKQK